jgi:hypothetical protein
MGQLSPLHALLFHGLILAIGGVGIATTNSALIKREHVKIDLDDSASKKMRYLTKGEKDLLKDIFGNEIEANKVKIIAYDVPYFSAEDARDKRLFGAFVNVETPYILHYSQARYCEDFSNAACPLKNKGSFSHEITHTWQNITPDAIKQPYESHYDYTLHRNAKFPDFHPEHQSAMLEDFVIQYLAQSKPCDMDDPLVKVVTEQFSASAEHCEKKAQAWRTAVRGISYKVAFGL